MSKAVTEGRIPFEKRLALERSGIRKYKEAKGQQ
jgi:hypothetical protein